MSQSVMTTTLIDFGKSIWTSSQLRQEYPGLISNMDKPIGQFGIGFFSIFMLSKKVKVISRKYDDSIDKTSILEFSDLSSRPILRKGDKKSLPNDVISRVSLLIENEKHIKSIESPIKLQSPHSTGNQDSILQRINTLIISLDVEVEINSNINDTKYQSMHSSDWLNTTSNTFISNLHPSSLKSSDIDYHSELLTPLTDNEGRVFGRAGLEIGRNYADRYRRNRGALPCHLTVGGFCVSLTHNRIFGVLKGSNINVARNNAKIDVPPEVLSSWYQEQSDLIRNLEIDELTKLEAHKLIYSTGHINDEMLFAFFEEKLQTYSAFKTKVENLDYILMPISDRNYNRNPDIAGISNLGYDYHNNNMKKNVIILPMTNLELFHLDSDEKDFENDEDLDQNIQLSDEFREECLEPITKIWDTSYSLQITAGTSFETKYANSIMPNEFIKIIKVPKPKDD